MKRPFSLARRNLSHVYMLIAVSIFSFGFFGKIAAQACCAGGSPISSNLQAIPTGQTGFQLLANYDYNNLEDLVQKSRKLEINNRQRITHAALIRPGYSFSHSLSVFAIFSYVSQIEENTNLNTGEKFRNQTDGIGDIVVMGQYAIFDKITTHLIGSAGVKLPTGSISHEDENGILLPADLQPGSGSWDGLLSLQYLRQDIVPGVHLTSIATYRLSSAADRFEGLQQYKFGNELQFFVGGSLPVLLNKSTVTPDLTFKLRNTSADETDGATTPNTSGTWLSLLPSVQFSFPNGVAFQLDSELPFYRNLEGTQLTTTYKLGVSFIYTFGNGKLAGVLPDLDE